MDYRKCFSSKTGIIDYNGFANVICDQFRKLGMYKNQYTPFYAIFLRKILTKECFSKDGLSSLGKDLVKDIIDNYYTNERCIRRILELNNVNFELRSYSISDYKVCGVKEIEGVTISEKSKNDFLILLHEDNKKFICPFPQEVNDNMVTLIISNVLNEYAFMAKHSNKLINCSVGKTIENVIVGSKDIMLKFSDGSNVVIESYLN